MSEAWIIADTSSHVACGLPRTRGLVDLADSGTRTSATLVLGHEAGQRGELKHAPRTCYT